MINIGIFHMESTAVSWYRTSTPLSLLRKTHRNINLVFIIPGYTDMAIVENCDIILINRPTTSSEYNLIKRAISFNCKVWIDMDDDIEDISIFNNSYESYAHLNPNLPSYSIDNYYHKCLGLADIVTVSTKALQTKLGKYNPLLLPNGVIPEYNYFDRETDFTICWRGSHTHRVDLELYEDLFKELYKKFKLHFFGWLPDWACHMPGVGYTRHQDLISFFSIFYESGVDFSVFPLQDIPFNHAKSNISFLESTKAGAAFFTNLKSIEFQQPGVGFDASVLLDLTDVQLRELKYSIHQQSMKQITEKFNIYTINELRLNIINDLCKF